MASSIGPWNEKMVWIYGLPKLVPAQVREGEAWNGFLVPRFDRETAGTVAATFADLRNLEDGVGYVSAAWEGRTLVMVHADEQVETWGPDEDGMYHLGAGALCWLDEEAFRAWLWQDPGCFIPGEVISPLMPQPVDTARDQAFCLAIVHHPDDASGGYDQVVPFHVPADRPDALSLIRRAVRTTGEVTSWPLGVDDLVVWFDPAATGPSGPTVQILAADAGHEVAPVRGPVALSRVDAQGRPCGIDREMLKRLADGLGIDLHLGEQD